MKESKAIDSFRRQFFEDRREKVRAHGIIVFDEACILFRDEENTKDVIVSDTFSSTRAHGSIGHFMAGIAASWWTPRQGTDDASARLRPTRGLYAHFLPQMNYDIVFEFMPGQSEPSALWRIDGRGRATPLPAPKDDGEFRDQTGTFMDLRFGWGWLAETYAQAQDMVAAEVETGYVIGIRAGANESELDPVEREDPAVQELADRYGRTRFDCVEILNADDNAALPFASEIFCEDLQARYLPGLAVDVFVLASSEAFVATVEEFADLESVDVAVSNSDEDAVLQFTCGPIQQSMNLAYPFLRTLYTARNFMDGVRDFIYPLIRQVASAHELLERLIGLLPEYTLDVDEFGVLTIQDTSGSTVSRRNLFRLSGQDWHRSDVQGDALLKLVGFDAETRQRLPLHEPLDTCPICERPSRVSKNIRPIYSLGDQSQRFAGVATDQHLIYYVQECEIHTVPLELEPGRDLSTLELEYQRGLASSGLSLLDAHHDEAENVWSFVGHDVSSAVLEPGRITALLHHFSIGLKQVWALAFYPDVLVLMDHKPQAGALRRMRHQAREAIQALFPDRLWAIDMVREIDVEATPVGQVRLVH